MAKLNYAKAAKQAKADYQGRDDERKRLIPRRYSKKALKVRRYFAADKQDRKSDRYWHWRKAVLKRDKYQCQDCQIRPAKLIAHHLKSWYDYPQYRFSVHNGITLCEDCHIKLHPWINPGRYQELKALIKTSKPRKIIRRARIE